MFEAVTKKGLLALVFYYASRVFSFFTGTSAWEKKVLWGRYLFLNIYFCFSEVIYEGW